MGFITALSTYCLSPAESLFLALPLKSRHILGAKFISTYLSDGLVSLLVMGVAVLVYGIKEGSPAGFYLEGLAVSLALPLLPLAFAYLVLIPLMRVARPLRNKNAVMIAGGVLGIGLALVFSFYTQSASARMEDPAWIRANLAGPDTVFARLGQVYLPAGLSWLALAGKGLASRAGALLGLFALGLAAATALVIGLGSTYTKSLAGFDEQLLKRRAASKGEFARLFRRRPIERALVDREIKLMNREPVYFFNGPFAVVIMPLVVGVMYFAQRDNLRQIGPMIASFAAGPGGLLSAAALGAFTGSSTGITSTAFSRDAKALAYLKALPISGKRYAAAKWLHGIIFAALGVLVGTGGASLVLGLDAATAAGAFVIALAFIAFANIGGLFLDAANPRLSWDTPIAASKQNPNAGIVVVGLMALLALLGFISASLPLGKLGFVLLYGGGFAALATALGILFGRYIEGRLAAMEP
jgi:ABC-2 type transport system permease protein